MAAPWWNVATQAAQKVLPKRQPVAQNFNPGMGVTPALGYNEDKVIQTINQLGLPQTQASYDTTFRTIANTPTNSGYGPSGVPANKRNTGTGSSGRGGGGGGGAAPQYSPEQIQWLTSLLAQSRPQQVQATNLDLPDYQGSFDPSMYNELEGRFGQAVASDRAAAQEAWNNYTNWLTSNYTNAFNNPNAQYATAGQAPGMQNQAMARMMQGQGVNPNVAAAQTEGQAAADAGFGNLWRVLAANEDRNQTNRLGAAQQGAMTTQRALDVAALQGQTGIGLQRSQAQAAWQQRMQEMQNQIAQQEALANWERRNQVGDLNASNMNSYTNAQLQALLSLLPELKGTTTPLPNLTQLQSGSPDPADPYNWKGIAAGIANGSIVV